MAARQVRPRILVTGFSVFPGAPVNPTEALVGTFAARPELLHDTGEIRTALLQVDYRELPQRLELLAKEFRPDIAVHFGLSRTAKGFRLERTARDLASTVTPDNSGFVPQEACFAGGAPSLASTLPIEEIEAALRGRDLPVELSDDCGDYLCNFLFYHSVGRRIPGFDPAMAGFVHVPPFPENAAGEATAGLSPDDLISGAIAIVKTCADAWRARSLRRTG